VTTCFDWTFVLISELITPSYLNELLASRRQQKCYNYPMRIHSLQDALAYYPNVDAFWDPEDLPKTEGQILALLPADWTTAWSAQSVELLTQLARAQALQGKLPEARATLDQARRMISETNLGPNSLAELRWNLEQGRMLCLSRSPTKAHDLFAAAWKMANEIHQPFFAIDAALMLSSVRPPKFQNEWLKKALAIAEESQDESANLWRSHLLFLEGWHSFDSRQFEGALEIFNKALAIPLNHGNAPQAFALRWSQARTLRALERTAEAMAIQESLLAQMRPLGKISGHVYLELAECSQLLKHKDEARDYFEQAHIALSTDPWYIDNRSDELERMKYLWKRR
jgi:tetratricopeptide (TPR) repeat protein